MKVTVSFDTVVFVEDNDIAQKVVIDNIADIIRQENYDDSIEWKFSEIKEVNQLPNGWKEKALPWADRRTPELRISEIFSKKNKPMKRVIGYYAVVLDQDSSQIRTIQTDIPYELVQEACSNNYEIIQNWQPVLL